jgi:hypothetical protein
VVCDYLFDKAFHDLTLNRDLDYSSRLLASDVDGDQLQRDSKEQRRAGLMSFCVTPPRIHSLSLECP